MIMDNKEDIINKLHELEEEYGIVVLYAVESGSRCWGFANEDSDYDVRFIYKYDNLSDYVRLNPRKDVISFMEGLYDFVGWDISKMLYLYNKSNPNLREWILSNHVYIDDTVGLFDDLPSFDTKVLLHHYYSMARNNWNDFCEGRYDWLGSDDEMLLIKKYLYVIRSILSWHIIRETDGKSASITVDDLLQECHGIIISDDLSEDIYSMISYYKGISGLSNSKVNKIREWVLDNLKYMKDFTLKVNTKYLDKNINSFNEKFFSLVMSDYVML